ncbi:hypothetical protein L1987_54978 [Smallanthus sonchifolius]|uniref:Uncharacterized protein n=1 Tax=Smallanthus sonchifolius TaxID=185202 RepID=A0ACB9E850_9ASTR|nr:hypothetical protein L1987_54978 [Smallanthus sonchifolius]
MIHKKTRILKNVTHYSCFYTKSFYIINKLELPRKDKLEHLFLNQKPKAARSPFFYKLFSKSAQGHATLRINASEEAGLMELLKFMYTNSLTVTTGPAVLDVLRVAHKFDVASCMRHCSRLLRNPQIMTPEFVLVYLDLPSTILMAEALHPLTIAVKQFFAVHYKDITKFEDEILSLPLACVEAIIASDDLQVTSEDEVYWFVLKWVRAQYPKIEDRREIISTRLERNGILLNSYGYIFLRVIMHIILYFYIIYILFSEIGHDLLFTWNSNS